MDAESHRTLPSSRREVVHFGGNRYVGEIHNGILTGYGIYYFDGGDRYEGEFSNDMRFGYGVYYAVGGDRYEGEHQDNEYDGNLVHYMPNGNRYEGEFEHHIYSGVGVFYFADGTRAEGQFRDGLLNGYGIYYSFGDEQWQEYRYDGEFGDSRYRGYGVQYKPDGQAIFTYFENGTTDRERTAIRTGVVAPEVSKSKPVRLTDIHETYTAQKNANVREAPDISAPAVAMLQKGANLQVIGQVEGENWYAVERDGEHFGYVWADLLTPFVMVRDQSPPEINIASNLTVNTDNSTLSGTVTDNEKVAQVTVDGNHVNLAPDGAFTFDKYVPFPGREITIIAFDDSGNKSTKIVNLTREAAKKAAIAFDPLNPTNFCKRR